jgi:carbon-monoxide dehydrogenase medium subunit
VKPAPFKVVRPQTLADACAALDEHGDDARLLAGGQSLVPMMNFRLSQPAVLVDLGSVAGLDHIEQRNGHLAVGAMVRQRVAELDETVRRHAPLFSHALPFVGHLQNRNRGTIGGSLAHADPAAELPAVALALDAAVRLVSSSGERVVPANQLSEGWFTTTLAPGEVLAETLVPIRPRALVGFGELARRHGDFAVAGVALVVELSEGGDVVERAGIAGFGVGSTPIRLGGVEEFLAGSRLDAGTINEASRRAASEVADPTDDVHASADYRREALGTLLARALLDVARQMPRATDDTSSLPA